MFGRTFLTAAVSNMSFSIYIYVYIYTLSYHPYLKLKIHLPPSCSNNLCVFYFFWADDLVLSTAIVVRSDYVNIFEIPTYTVNTVKKNCGNYRAKQQKRVKEFYRLAKLYLSMNMYSGSYFTFSSFHLEKVIFETRIKKFSYQP